MAELVVYSSTGNQYLTPAAGTDYATVHDHAGTYVLTQEFSLPLGQNFLDPWYYVRRLGLLFDTTSIPTTAVILSVVLSFQLLADYTDTDFSITVVSGADLADDGLVAADFGDLLDDTVSRGSKSTAGLSLNTYYDITLDATSRGEITKSGITKFGIRSSRDINSSVPSGDERALITSTDQEGKGVKLTINYLTAPGYIWTEGDKAHFISENREQKILGGDTGVDAIVGHLFVEGNYVHFISQNGDERRQMGKLTNRWGYIGGHIWIDDMWLYYIDSSGYERKLGTWMLGQSHLGVDTILHT